jgi:hypothetical protein
MLPLGSFLSKRLHQILVFLRLSIIFWVFSSEGWDMAPAGHISSQPRQNTTHASRFFTMVFFLLFSSLNPNAFIWQKSTHFPHETHFLLLIFGAQGIWFLGIPSYVSSDIGFHTLILNEKEGRGRDLNPGKRLHRPLGYQATSPRPPFQSFFSAIWIALYLVRLMLL